MHKLRKVREREWPEKVIQKVIFRTDIQTGPLKRQAQNLDINPWFPNTTNLFQTCPTRPKTHIQRVKDGNGNKTTTHLRNRVRNTIKQ